MNNNKLISCVLKEDVNVHGFKIKARTKGLIISPRLPEVDCCVGVSIYINTWDIKEYPFDKYVTFNSIINPTGDYGLGGIVINTETNNIAIDISSHDYYYNSEIYDWQIKRILNVDTIPNCIHRAEYGNKYKLIDLVYYMNYAFSEWVSGNGIFEEVAEEMLESEEISSEFEVGQSYLVNDDDFYEEQLKYKQKLETIGYTYEFDGGLQLFD